LSARIDAVATRAGQAPASKDAMLEPSRFRIGTQRRRGRRDPHRRFPPHSRPGDPRNPGQSFLADGGAQAVNVLQRMLDAFRDHPRLTGHEFG
jgi:hypothetical protein